MIGREVLIILAEKDKISLTFYSKTRELPGVALVNIQMGNFLREKATLIKS